MKPMTREDWRAFLLEGTRTAKLVTMRAAGRPHVAPVWFDLDGEGGVLYDGERFRQGQKNPS